jgi:precorrin-6A/cobalt-precorrin-6A reductase
VGVKPCLWVIGGTHESRELIAALPEHMPEPVSPEHISVVVSVTTEAALGLYEPRANLKGWVERLSEATIGDFLQTFGVTAIVDMSHPFAIAISQLAMQSATQYQLPYLRYERPSLEDSTPLAPQSPSIITIETYADLFERSLLASHNVLLTIGHQGLSYFRPYQQSHRLFARILPTATALEAAQNAGFTADRLMAMRPPISLALEKALCQQWQISLIVAKASGHAGGEAFKRSLVQELGLTLVLLKRPPLSYIQVTAQFSAVLAFCRDAIARF